MTSVELDRTAVDRVLRRANELAPAPPGSPVSFSEEVVLAAAAEAGLDLEAVRVSLAVERLGPSTPTGRADALVGPGHVVHERVLPIAAGEAVHRLDMLLVRQHQLRTVRTRPDGGEWRRRKGPIGTVQRAALAVTGETGLSRVARATATASVVGDDRSVLRLIADRRSQRSAVAAGGAAVGAVGLVGVAVTSVVVGPLLLLTTPLAIGAGVAVAAQGRRQASALACELDEVFDALERGAAPVTLTDNIRRVVRNTRGQLD